LTSHVDDDVSLIMAYLDGEAAAFDTLFRRYHDRVRSVCMRYIGDEATAEDLVQETFFNVIRALNRVTEGFNFGAWVHRIAVNICQDELRRRNRRAIHLDQGGGDQTLGPQLLQRLADPPTLLGGGRHERKPRGAHGPAHHLERGLHGDGVRGDEQGVEQGAQ